MCTCLLGDRGVFRANVRLISVYKIVVRNGLDQYNMEIHLSSRAEVEHLKIVVL